VGRLVHIEDGKRGCREGCPMKKTEREGMKAVHKGDGKRG